ncbi:hypothetical protein [Bacillus dakarensis]|uniref:hypothetical protein n=1 Tax=Robertmurraya dakarensis TaxID=1926278 RepID=UPI00098225A9|nr:hypothetical protein [Bacillus dakarensis]
MSKNRKQPIFRADKVIIHADEVIVIEARDKRRFDRDEDAAEEMDRQWTVVINTMMMFLVQRIEIENVSSHGKGLEKNSFPI